MKTLFTILTSVIITLGVIVYFFNYVPFSAMGFLTFNRPLNVGTTLTSLQSSDTMSDFPTLYNANNTALNAGKIEVSTTTLPLITTLSSLSSIGTITTGVWSGTAILTAKGGTGSTTLSQFNVLLGSSTNAIGIVSGLGSDGQFLTSQGAGLPPVWETSSVDQGIAYTWTGLHTFNTAGFISNASSTLTATTTILANSVTNNALVLNGQAYKWPTSQNASSSVLMTNGSGGLIWDYPQMRATTTSRVKDATSATVSLAHSLGRAPRFVNIKARSGDTAATIETSDGFSDGTNNYSVNFICGDSGDTSFHSNVDTGAAIYFSCFSGAVNGQSATITLDATNINVVWTKLGSGATYDISILLTYY